MNITLIGNKIVQDTKFLGFEKNNGVDVINITVDTDEEWTYKLDVKYPEKCCSCEQLYNIIDLTRNGNVCTVVLTKDMLPFTGKYIMQLRAISSDKVQHSDTFDAWVKYSIEPGSTYNPVPSEFYQIEQSITEINNHPPYPDISGFWMIWNSQTNKYELSDIPAVTASDIGAIPVPTTASVGQTIVVKAVDENGKPTEWEPVTLPEQVRADWNQNDETASDYIKNRPFYDTSIVTYIVPESTVAFSDHDGKMGALWPESFDAVEGQTYTISWDGTDYEGELTPFYDSFIIGNISISGAGSDTGEPFLFLYNGGQWFVMTKDSASEHVISIKIVTPQIVQIDKKFLPTAKKFVVDATNLPSDTTGWGKLYASLDAAHNAGDEIFLDADGTGGSRLFKLTNVYDHSVYLFMYATNGTSVSAYILTVYVSDGGSLQNISFSGT